jgi:hypothetical protein
MYSQPIVSRAVCSTAVPTMPPIADGAERGAGASSARRAAQDAARGAAGHSAHGPVGTDLHLSVSDDDAALDLVRLLNGVGRIGIGRVVRGATLSRGEDADEGGELSRATHTGQYTRALRDGFDARQAALWRSSRGPSRHRLRFKLTRLAEHRWQVSALPHARAQRLDVHLERLQIVGCQDHAAPEGH